MDTKIVNMFPSVEYDTNLLFELAQMMAILYFTPLLTALEL